MKDISLGTGGSASVAAPRTRLDMRRLGLLALGAGFFGVLLLGLFARLMTYEMRKDEQLYLSPARLLGDWSLYTDIFYNHVPGSAWFYRIVYLAMGGDALLLAGRFGVFLFWVVLIVAVAWLTFELARSVTLALTAVLVVLCNELLLGPTGAAATNNLLPLPLAYLGMGLCYLAIGRQMRPRLAMGLAGLALAAAAATKISFIAFVPVVLVAALLLPRQLSFRDRLRDMVLPLAIGGVIGALPVMYYLATAPDTFLAHVLGYHVGPHRAYFASQGGGEDDVAVSAGEKLRFAYQVWLSGANLFLVFLVGLVAAKAVLTAGWRPLLEDRRILVAAAAAAMAVVISFVPTPSFPQYYSLPVICLLLLLALLFRAIPPQAHGELRISMFVVGALLVLLSLPRLGAGLPQLLSPKSWTVSKVHRAGVEMRAVLEREKAGGKVATLAPLYPLEVGLPVYAELATGPFAYRVGDLAAPDLLARYRTTSPSRIAALFAADPPAALLLGFDTALEEPMLRFAEANGYRKVDGFAVKDRYGTGSLYVRTPPGP